jgi:hypothetical protein
LASGTLGCQLFKKPLGSGFIPLCYSFMNEFELSRVDKDFNSIANNYKPQAAFN